METPITEKPAVAALLQDVDLEIARAFGLFPPMNSPHEAYATILEELDEFWDEVKVQDKLHNPKAMKKELIQTAAMCVRAIYDLNL